VGLRIAVLGINYAPEPTGIAPYTTRIASGLRERGHHVRVVTAFPHYPQWRLADGYSGLSRREVIDEVPVKRLRHYVPSRPTGARRALSEMSFGARLMTSSWGRPDVVICASPALLSSAMAFARSGRAPVGVVVQDLYSAGLEEQGNAGRAAALVAGVERRLLRRVDGVAVIHDRFAERCIDRLGVPPERLTVIRNWTHVPEPEAFDRGAIREQLGWGEQETVVLHTGAMGVKQGLHTVVESARLASARGARVRFVLVGDGGQRPELEQLAEGVGSLDFVDPLPGAAYGQTLRSADVLLVNERPGLVEMAVPSKLTSYFSTGLPVLAATEAASTTASEIAASGAGIRIEPGQPEQLLAGVLALASDPARSREVGQRGPTYCETVLAEETALDAYDAWVRRLARTKRPRRGRGTA